MIDYEAKILEEQEDVEFGNMKPTGYDQKAAKEYKVEFSEFDEEMFKKGQEMAKKMNK